MAALREVKTWDAQERIALARSVLAQAEAAHSGTTRSLGAPILPVAHELEHLLPAGGLQCGAITQFEGSTGLLLHLIARASQEGSWCAVVGFPEIGGLAAAQCGVELSRLALIPDPGAQAGQVLAALVDGIDLIVVGRAIGGQQLRPAVQRQLAARAKERGAVIISLQDWSGAQHSLRSRVLGWRGLGQGSGYLRKQDLILGRAGRGNAQRRIEVEVSLPLRTAAIRDGVAQDSGSARVTGVAGPTVDEADSSRTVRPGADSAGLKTQKPPSLQVLDALNAR